MDGHGLTSKAGACSTSTLPLVEETKLKSFWSTGCFTYLMATAPLVVVACTEVEILVLGENGRMIWADVPFEGGLGGRSGRVESMSDGGIKATYTPHVRPTAVRCGRLTGSGLYIEGQLTCALMAPFLVAKLNVLLMLKNPSMRPF